MIRQLADVVSKNGTLLLSIPVRGEGTLDERGARDPRHARNAGWRARARRRSTARGRGARSARSGGGVRYTVKGGRAARVAARAAGGHARARRARRRRRGRARRAGRRRPADVSSRPTGLEVTLPGGIGHGRSRCSRSRPLSARGRTRMIRSVLALLAAAGAVRTAAQASAAPPAARSPARRAVGRGTAGSSAQHGQPVTLRGMSLFWSQWAPQYYAAETVDWLAQRLAGRRGPRRDRRRGQRQRAPAFRPRVRQGQRR